ncbi:MAG: succinyl-diaminopimelate desuccinylase [Pseudomonadales bacterium]
MTNATGANMTDDSLSAAVLKLTCDLIRRTSVTPEDAGCQALIANRLQPLGFVCETLRFGDVDNLWAVRAPIGARSGRLFAFAGHTDVVPTGPVEDWQTPPFEPVVRDGRLFGRGAADMKGSLAAMVVATERFLAAHPDCPMTIAFLLTSDEEGPAIHGTRAVMETLAARGTQIDWCIVGEPSSTTIVGDVVRVGRRGSLSGKLNVLGIQGHVAYPERADNPIHRALPVLAELASRRWDEGNAFFPATSFQISNIHAGTGAGNVIPGSLSVDFNFRYSTEQTAAALESEVESALNRAGLRHELTWQRSGSPFLTASGALIDAVNAAITAELGQEPERSTGGGTSDGRFIAPTGAEVIELGPVNATIHKIDECVAIEDLARLARLYRATLDALSQTSVAPR